MHEHSDSMVVLLQSCCVSAAVITQAVKLFCMICIIGICVVVGSGDNSCFWVRYAAMGRLRSDSNVMLHLVQVITGDCTPLGRLSDDIQDLSQDAAGLGRSLNLRCCVCELPMLSDR